MKYRRALLLVEPEKEASARTAIHVLRRVAPSLEHLLVMVLAPARNFAWLSSGSPLERDEPTASLLEALSEETARTAAKVDVQVAPEFEGDALAALCAAEEIDLLVFGSRSVLSVSVLSMQRRHLEVAVLWTEGGSAASGALTELGCVALDARARAALGAFLRDHTDRAMHVTLLAPAPPPSDALAKFLPIAGIEASVEVSSPRDAASMGPWLGEWMRERPIDLLVFAGMPSALLLGALRSAPVLLLPPVPAARTFGQRGIDVADLIDAGGPLRLRIDHLATVGSQTPVPDQPFGFIAGGRIVATATTSAGEAELPAGLAARSLGVCRLGRGSPMDPLAALEQRISVIRPGERPLLLFDAELPQSVLLALHALASASASDCLAIRLRPTRSSHSIRVRLRDAGLFSGVLDARVVLDEGEALDVSEAHDAVRLARVAARLQSAGFPVRAIVHGAPVEPSVHGFVALNGSALGHPEALQQALASPEASPPAGLLETLPIGGNQIALELSNKTARGYLLDAIESSRETLHVQVYMAADDEIGGPVEAALAEAAARGVCVKVLVDSLHGLHGSFGTQNPLLSRLASRPGVELRASRPI